MRRAAACSMAAFVVLGAASAGGAPAATGGALPAYIATAIADPARPGDDTGRDANRKPGATLAFAGVRPGERVLELAPGKGYYTRLLSVVVGPSGRVYAVTSPPRPGASGAAPTPPPVQAIAADPHYANVTVLQQRAAELAPPETVDLVWTSQNYHDFHNIPNVDIASINSAVFKALKPGGIFLVLDHSAQAGSGARDTSTLHRIDEDTVKQELEAAGFKFVGETDILRNKADPRTAKVFDPSIQGHTDQFILKFRKP
jgi:predicted methyltransferase